MFHNCHGLCYTKRTRDNYEPERYGYHVISI